VIRRKKKLSDLFVSVHFAQSGFHPLPLCGRQRFQSGRFFVGAFCFRRHRTILTSRVMRHKKCNQEKTGRHDGDAAFPHVVNPSSRLAVYLFIAHAFQALNAGAGGAFQNIIATNQYRGSI
jgi:hypothetical protein